jgi:hypothetical protein
MYRRDENGQTKERAMKNAIGLDKGRISDAMRDRRPRHTKAQQKRVVWTGELSIMLCVAR